MEIFAAHKTEHLKDHELTRDENDRLYTQIFVLNLKESVENWHLTTM